MSRFFRHLVFLMAAIVAMVAAAHVAELLWLNQRHHRAVAVYWSGSPSEREVALTFDDGPNEPYTSQILDVLKAQGVHATFFLLGKNVEVYPGAARRELQEGHVVGNHSYSHPDMLLETDAEVRGQLSEASDAIAAATGTRPTLFRPPYGLDDPLTFVQAKRMGYTVIKWSVSSEDWKRPGVQAIVDRVRRGAHNGAIILLHDGNRLDHGSDRSQTVEALPVIIRELRDAGYAFVTVPDLIGERP